MYCMYEVSHKTVTTVHCSYVLLLLLYLLFLNRGESVYSRWRERMQKARDDASPVFTPRGNSLKVNLGGVTDRAGEMRSPRVRRFP